jgi:hypothetical protein
LSTLALEGSERIGGGRLLRALRYADLAVLALALPAFLLAGWPLLGYAVIAVVWLVQRWVQVAAERRTSRALADGDRRSAMGVLAWSILGRVWMVTLSILLVGGLAERQDGLAAALLGAVLVTVSLGTQALSRTFGEGQA